MMAFFSCLVLAAVVRLDVSHPVEVLDFGPASVGGYPTFASVGPKSAADGAKPRLRASYATHPDGLGPKGDFWRETAARYLGKDVDLPILPANIDRYDVFEVDGAGEVRAKLLQGQVRYVRLELENAAAGAALGVEDFRFVNDRVHSEGERDGSFACSDDRLTRLWEASIRTCELSAIPSYEATHVAPSVVTRPYLADGGKRDRLVWSGDLWWAQRNVYFGFRPDEPYMRGSLEMLAANQLPDGYVQACPWPEQRPPKAGEYGPFGSDEFAAWFVPVLWDHVLYRGDTALAADLWPNVVRLMGYLDAHRRPDGLLEPRKETSKHAAGLTFGGSSLHHRSYVNILIWKTLKDAESLARLLGHGDEADRWCADAARLAGTIRRTFWDAKRGWFRNAVEDDAYAPEANPLALAVRFANADEAPRVIASLRFHDHGKFQLLAARGRFESGDAEGALGMIAEQRWFQLLDPNWRGPLTTPESCRPRRGGWGDESHPDTALAGVFSNYLLGIEPTEPGFARFAFRPQPASLAFAAGDVPTPHGAIRAKWTRVTGGLAVEIDVPEGTMADFAFGKFRRELKSGHAAFVASDDPLAEGWRMPPAAARPHTWWHWMNGNVTKKGITADLEAMKAVGLGGVQLFDAGLPMPEGPVAFASESWYDHVAFAAHEAERLGLSFGLANCSGWTSSGGPWITPEYGMKFVTNTTVRVTGGRRVEMTLPLPPETNGFYADIAVLAFPTPAPARIDDFERRTFRLRGDERGPFPLKPLAADAFTAEQCVKPDSVVDLTDRMAADGKLVWDAPAGEWTILRVGYMANGRKNRPATKGGSGLECDKLDPKALDLHFSSYLAKVFAAVGPCKAFDNILIDSYEVNGQNWTHGFEKEFAKRKGYDIRSFLPILAGYPVGSVAETERFLRDFRRVIADLFAENYGGRMAELCHKAGVAFACEPYGNSPSDDLQYGATCDIPMGEFWRFRGDGRSMYTRWGHRMRGNGPVVASVAHVWGKPIVGAEAFTAYPTATSGRWLEHPGNMKAQGDRVLADGVNRFYFHRYVHQPWTEPTRYPGMTMAYYGGHFERTQTWWDTAFKAYVGYLTRAQYMLQRGVFVADVLFDVGDEAPNYGTAGEVPYGWRADHVPSAALSRLTREADGSYVSPGGTRYRLVLNPMDDVVKALAEKGVAADFRCDADDVAWIHRRDGDDEIYFVANSVAHARTVRCSFRDAEGVAELWHPETGEIRRIECCRDTAGRADVVLELGESESVFVVFRGRPTSGALPPERRGTVVAAHEIEGPWQVAFREPGAKTDVAQVKMAALMDWTAHTEESVRYFSGTATYRVTMRLPKTVKYAPFAGCRYELDLGDVRDVAEVAVNGRTYPVLWKPPFRVDVTDAVRGGANAVEIKVTNRWPNRLIGDERLCGEDADWSAANDWKLPLVTAIPEWVEKGEKSPAGRHAFAATRLWTATDALLPSGLLGPVKCAIMDEQRKGKSE